MTPISERLLLLIDLKMQTGKRFKSLEALTGVPARKWNSFTLRKQESTIEMIEAASKIWPQHAFWLATGIEDAAVGHTNPSMRESAHSYQIEDVTEELFRLKLSTKYEPEKLSGLLRKSVDEDNYQDYKNFAHLFDDDGYISKLNVSVRLLSWLSKEEEVRPEYELEEMRSLLMSIAPMTTRAQEVFFGFKENANIKKDARPGELKLIEPYRSQVLKLKKATSAEVFIDTPVVKKNRK
jgi:hypothetical protein